VLFGFSLHPTLGSLKSNSMNIAKTLLAIIWLTLLISCGSNDTVPIFKKEDFIGAWERTSTTVDPGSCTTSTEKLTFTQTVLTTLTTCNGTQVSYDSNYTFDNKDTIILTIMGVSGKLVILQLTSTLLRVDLYAGSQKQGSSTYKKV
jgi:hypothetical protein